MHVRSRALPTFCRPSFQQNLPISTIRPTYMYTENSINKNIFIALAQNWMQVMLPRLMPKQKDSIQETTFVELEFASMMTEFWLETHLLPNGVFNAMKDKDLARDCSEYMTWSWYVRLEMAKRPERPAWLPESDFFVRLPMQ